MYRASVTILLELLALTLGAGCHDELTTNDGEPNNVVASGDVAYASLGAQGVRVRDLASGADITTIAPPAGGIHDVALDGNLLFTLDADAGQLSVFDVTAPAAPVLVSGPLSVPQTRFGGVSARAGHVVVSGGTSELSVHSYDASGQLGDPIGTSDLGTGQPDVLANADGSLAFVSTHFASKVDGNRFGITALALPSMATLDRLGLDGAGFSPGTASPANFAIESALEGNLLLVAHGDGLAIVNVADPAALDCTAVVELDVHAVSVDAAGGIAYVVGIEPTPTLVVVDVAAAAVVRSEALEGLPTGVAVGDGAVVIAAGPAGLLVRNR